MSPQEARDDEREALIARLKGAKALFHEFYSTGVAPLSLDFDPAYEAIEDAVRVLRAGKHPEPDIADAELPVTEQEREALDRLPNGDLRVTDVLGRTARLHWSRFHGLIVATDAPAVYLGQPETLAWIAESAGLAKIPEPEITDEMVDLACNAFGGIVSPDWAGASDWERTVVSRSIRTALEAALRVPVREGE